MQTDFDIETLQFMSDGLAEIIKELQDKKSIIDKKIIIKSVLEKIKNGNIYRRSFVGASQKNIKD